MEERLKEELHDVVTYSKMAREASCERDRRILTDIAKEEYTHAKHLADMMRWHGEYHEPTVDWEIATEALHTLW